MGAAPSVTFNLIESTPYRLRYLCISTGNAGSSVLPNAAGVTPDLRTDSLGAAEAGTLGLLLRRLVQIPVANQAEARALLLEERTGAAPAIIATGLQAQTRIYPRLGAGGTPDAGGVWAVDANEGAAAGDPASAGFPVLVVTPPSQVADITAYLDIHLKHSYKDGPTTSSPSTGAAEL